MFRENTKRQMIADSITLSRAVEVAREFNRGEYVPSRLYTRSRTQSPQNF